MKDPRFIVAAIAAIGLFALAGWSLRAGPSVAPPAEAPIAARIAAAPPVEAPAEASTAAPGDARQVAGYWTPGAAPTAIALAPDARAFARCGNGWEQLVRVRDTAGVSWFVGQQDAPPDPAQLGPDGLLPLDPHAACTVQRLTP